MNLQKRFLAVGVFSILALTTACSRSNNWETYNLAGKEAYERRDFPEAEKQWQAARAAVEKLGPQDPRRAAILSNLAELYRIQGRYAEAEDFNERALAIWQKNLGNTDDPNVAQALNSLALTYGAQGKSSQAEPLFKRSLAIREKVLGPEHPTVAESLENYGALLRKSNRESEAVPLEERAKAIRAKNASK